MTCMIAIGTRPEAIKMAPLIRALQEDNRFLCRVCHTGQHDAIFDDAFSFFEILPDYNLESMKKGQDLSSLSARITMNMGLILTKTKPDVLIVHGDTASTLAASLAAYYHKVPIIHVEAGLRSHDLSHPWPEEVHRKIVSLITKFHLAPTQQAMNNLLDENVPSQNIEITGNTGIDALLLGLDIIQRSKSWQKKIDELFSTINPDIPLVLVTAHRRENHGPELKELARALIRLTENQNCSIAIPVHPNPLVKKVMLSMLRDRERIHLFEPLAYPFFISLMKKSKFIMTDSGGIQEEAPSLRKPVIVLRNKTERQEGIFDGFAELCPMKCDLIYEKASTLLLEDYPYQKLIHATNPYGNGTATSIIIDSIVKKFSTKENNKKLWEAAS